MGLALLENSYQYRGYYSFQFYEFNPKYINNLDDYIKDVYIKLGECVVNTNETLDIDEFFEFKKSTALKINIIF